MKSNFLIILILITVAVISAILFFSVFNTNSIPKPLPDNSFNLPNEQNTSSHSLTPVISNQWYSTLFSSFPTQPIYALPLVYELSPGGLGFSYPYVKTSPNAITSTYDEDFRIGFDAPFLKPKINKIGDWNININLTNSNDESLNFFMAHGLPFSVIHTNGENLKVTFLSDFTILNPENNKAYKSKVFSADSVIITTKNNFYTFIFTTKTNFSIKSNIMIIKNPKRIFIGLLDKKTNFDKFKEIANIEILDSKITFDLDNSMLSNTYEIETNGVIPLVALYPHQYDTLSSKKDALGEYETIRGKLKLIKTNLFTTNSQLYEPLAVFEKISDDPSLIKQIKTDISNVINKNPPNSKDYYLGTWFGKISNLILLADTYGLKNERDNLLKYVKPIFINSLSNFYYDKNKTSLIAKNPEFGNEKLNDHHFHYGYYIRTAAVLVNYDLSVLPKITDQINNIVEDIASIQRDSNKYPFLRNFDVYEGHSWADGYGDTISGNNQESSSEAINAWYGVYLWSKVINDKNLEEYALYLYNTEVESANYYWFDIKNIYGNAYKHKIASIVWGGKVDFATWFSDTTNMKYGIQLLPFTPASDYLGKLPDFSGYDNDYHKNGGDESKSWGDLFVMWKSYYFPKSALALKNKIQNFYDENPKSLFLYYLLYNYSKLENQDKIN